MRMLAMVVVCGAAVWAQAAKPLEFEVASVKPSKGAAERVAIGVHVDGAQVHIADFTLRDYIRVAYRVKLYQVVGAEDLSERFNVDAKLPEGATRDQVPEMLQALLASRFELKTHRESKEFPVYALSVVTGGVKMKESAPEANDPAPAGTNVAADGSARGVALDFGHGSAFTFAGDKILGTKLTMTVFADTLARFVDRPVVDRTGLTGRYDFAIEIAPEDYQTMLIQSAVTAGVRLPTQALQMLDGARDESLYNGLQKLGLRMAGAKAPLDVIVVDHIAKTPVEN